MHYDFFVSYARADNVSGWITKFVEELLAEHSRFSAGRDLKPFCNQHAITTGADWQLYLAHGIAHSRLFLAFLSPNDFASEWCRKEWRAWMDAEIAQHILTAGVRPIYIVEVPGLTGKGQLSEQHAHAYASAYPGGRFLIRCEGKSVLRDAVLGQSDFTGLFGEQISNEERKLPDAYFAAILRCLRTRLDRFGHVLLVFDNVFDLTLLGHKQTQVLTALGPQLHLLATTRLIPPAGGKGNWLSLGQLPDDDALDLLEKYRPTASAAEREAALHMVEPSQ